MGQISASPNIIQHEADELLLIGSYDNSMYTFSTSSGKKVSQFETGYYINGAASVWGNYMLFGGCDGWLRMANTITGEQTDSMQLKAYVPASPAVMGDYAFVSDYNGNLYELQLADGRIAKHRLLITAKENILIPLLANASKVTAEQEEYAEFLIKTLGIEHIKNQTPSTLSGGEKARVSICRALINRPSLLLADEPTGQLDAENAEVIASLLQKVNEDFGTTIILVTHDSNIASKAKRTLRLANGNIQ